MKKLLLLTLAVVFNAGIQVATAHDLGGLPHPHPHVGGMAVPEGALALVLAAGLMTAWTLRIMMRRSGGLEGSNAHAGASLRRKR